MLKQLLLTLAVGAGIVITECRAESEGTSQQTNPPVKPGRESATPARTGFADLGGVRIYYQVHGDLASRKTPLLILHGSYMSGDAMMPLIEQFAATRPVIAIDQRGHGRTGDLPGPITYDLLADDAARVLRALNVPTADVLGYSMGGVAAIFMAVRHPEQVGKQVILSGTSGRSGWYPELVRSLAQVTPQMFAGTPLEAEYKRLSPTPDSFPALVQKLRDLGQTGYEQPDKAIRAIHDKTMIVLGDADGVSLEHAIALFKLRGGGDLKTATQGFMTEAPRARLAILPATPHIGIMAQAKLIAELATPFLDDAKPIIPPGFLPDAGQHKAAKGTAK